jgi:hypothetical protein
MRNFCIVFLLTRVLCFRKKRTQHTTNCFFAHVNINHIMPPSTARRRRKLAANKEDEESTPPSTPPRGPRSSTAKEERGGGNTKLGKIGPPKSPIKRAIKLVRTQLYRPKIPIFSSAFVLAIIFIIAPYVDKTYHKISEEGRVASDLGDVRFDVGKFTVQVREAD